MRRPKNGRRLEDDLQKLLLSAKEIINLQNLDNQIIHLPGRKLNARVHLAGDGSLKKNVRRVLSIQA